MKRCLPTASCRERGGILRQQFHRESGARHLENREPPKVQGSRTMKRCAVAILMALVVGLSAGLWGQSVSPNAVSSDPVEKIRALEIARNVAIAHGDVSALDKMTSDDYTFITMGGQLRTKADVLKESSSNAFKYEYRQIADLKIRIYGNAAVVTGCSVQTRQENGKDYGDVYRFTRVYIRQKGYWLSVALQTTRVTALPGMC
jgi:ketosteroid isomerase-like protein